MKYKDPAIQSLLLDLYMTHGTDTAVARLSGVSRTVLWRMNVMSEEGHPDLQEVDWAGTIKPWHEQRLCALDMLIEDVQQRMTHDAGQGQYVPVVHGGEYKFEDDEYAVSLSPKEFYDALDLGLVWHDKKKRVLNERTRTWERVRCTQYIPPTLDAQSKVLASFAPEIFGDKRKIDLQVSGGLGVSVIGTNIKPPQHLVDVTPTVEAITDESVTDEIIIEPEPEVTMPEQPFTADPNSPLTEEQQRILARSRSTNPLAAELAARAAAKIAQANAPVAPKPFQPPPPSVYRGDDQDDCVQRQPRGQKVV